MGKARNRTAVDYERRIILRIQSFKPGDRVGYARRFLKSIQGDYDMWQARGIVEAVKPFGERCLITVKWDRDMPDKVIDANLAKLNTVEFVD